jgi:hypothetical protein
MSDEQNDYSEIFTPTDPRDGWAEGSEMNSAMSGMSGRSPSCPGCLVGVRRVRHVRWEVLRVRDVTVEVHRL